MDPIDPVSSCECQASRKRRAKQALESLPAGAGRAEMERTRDEVLAPLKSAEEAACAQAQAASQADLYLIHVDSYLESRSEGSGGRKTRGGL